MQPLRKMTHADEMLAVRKRHYKVALAAVLVTALIFVIPFVVTHIKKGAELRADCAKHLRIKRNLDSLSLKQFICITNVGDENGLFNGLRLTLTSLRRRTFQMIFESDSCTINKLQTPFTAINVSENETKAIGINFISQMDSVIMNTIPAGMYEYRLEMLKNGEKSPILLYKNLLYFDENTIGKLRGEIKTMHRRKRRYRITSYPEIDTQLLN